MNFDQLLQEAKMGSDEAKVLLLQRYKGLLVNHSKVDGRFDEDLFQEQCITLLRCIHYFDPQKDAGPDEE